MAKSKKQIFKKSKKDSGSHKTHLWAIILMFCTTALTSTAQAMYKLGIPSLKFNLISIITNWPIIAGLAIYGVAAVMMIIALKGGEVSVLYPIIATSYIWVSLISMIFFHETMNPLKWGGVAVIFAGVVMINLGSRDHEVRGMV